MNSNSGKVGPKTHLPQAFPSKTKVLPELHTFLSTFHQNTMKKVIFKYISSQTALKGGFRAKICQKTSFSTCFSMKVTQKPVYFNDNLKFSKETLVFHGDFEGLQEDTETTRLSSKCIQLPTRNAVQRCHFTSGAYHPWIFGF